MKGRPELTYADAAKECHGGNDTSYFRGLLRKARSSSFWEFGWPNGDSEGPPEAVRHRLTLEDVQRLAIEEGERFPK